MQPHDLGQILGTQQLLGIVKRSRHVLFGVRDRLAADVLGARPNARALAFDLRGGLLRLGHEIFKGLAGLIEARLRHRSHFLWNFETVASIVSHRATPLRCRAVDPAYRPMASGM